MTMLLRSSATARAVIRSRIRGAAVDAVSSFALALASSRQDRRCSVRSAMKRISLGKDPAFDRWLKEGRDREKRMIVAKGDASPDLSTLSARVVEAAVERKRRRDAWMVCREPGDGSSPKYVAYTEAIGELDAAVDAYRKAKEGR